jgi:asparagine synthase (glutamine-hydrolysing)
MCGIAGVIAWDDRYRASRRMLEAMSAQIAHRGPDAQGAWINHEQTVTPQRPQAALAHRRLSIIDLDKRANQPMTDGRGLWIVFNGEIYNYRDLRRELTGLRPDYAWRTQSDTEVLLAAYAQWGERCPEHLNGMFAFAVWDENRKELFLARDRMGQKPLYYALQGASDPCDPFDVKAQAVAFASELGALRHVDWLNAQPNIDGMAEYLTLGYFPGLSTAYRQVAKLMPGEWLKVACGATARDFYFDCHPEPMPDSAARQWTRSLTLTAVGRQMVADVPIGCFLSGGVDSSIVAAAMKAAVGGAQRILTFSIGFDDPRYDETAYAAQIAQHLGTRHRRFVVRPDAAADLPRLARAFGEPFADSSALPTHYLARETRQHVKVALSGDGGDELFGGYDRYRAMRLGQRLRRALSPLPWMAIAPLARALGGGHPKSRRARLARFLESLGRSPARRYQRYMRIFNDDLACRLLGIDHVPGADLLAGVFSAARRDGLDAVQAALTTDRVTYLPDDLLVKLDRCSMLHALEVRSPFMDHELVQFAAGLSTDQLLGGGPKRMLREAFAQDLPAWVFERPKMGFAVPIGEWFRGELRPMLRDHLFAADSFAKQHFNMPLVGRLLDEHEQERVDHSERLYALLMLELWWKAQDR